jgi:uncharacterized membrane protein YhaH (DUF805 family)
MSATVTLREHFKRLFDFTGREDLTSFWQYAALSFLIVTVAGGTIFVPMMIHTIQAMQQFAIQHPDQVTETSGPGEYSISVHGAQLEFIPAGTMSLFLAVSFGMAIVLYAAAVVRRLRDRGKSGFWGLMPLPFIIYSSIEMPRMFSAFGTGREPDMRLFFAMFLSNFLYIATLVSLIVLLAGPSAKESGR